MKFPEHKLFMETVRLPSPVQKWFGHQLELRGIDSVIYSRHIIHLLQQDDDEIQDYVDLLFDSKTDKKHHCKAARYDKKKVKNSEDRKKSAAIECLQAVSDEDNDIEKLVEELCHKLKNLEQHDGGDVTSTQEPATTTSSSESDSSSSEFENPAERYYAAFPALHGKDQYATPNESESVWKNNPITKPKSGQAGEVESESPSQKELPTQQQQEQLSPKTQGRKKKRQTVRKLHARRTPSKREEPCPTVCRFLSWPNGSLNIEKLDKSQPHSLQDQELCSQVENMLKEMLLQKEEQALKMPCPKERMIKPTNANDSEIAGGNSPRGSDGSVSPELQEDDSWYTQPIDILFTSEEPRQRLYKRNNSSSPSPYQQRSDSNSPVSASGSVNQHSPNDSVKENQFLFAYSTPNTNETTISNSFPADLPFSLFHQSEPKAIPSPNSALNPEPSGFSVFSPFDDGPLVSSFNGREERHQANSITENISNSLSLTTVSDLEDMNKGVEDLDLDADCTSPENLLDHHYIEELMNTANDQELYYWDNNLQSFDDFLPWTMATTWPSKVLVDDIMPEVSWDERYEGYSADFYNHLKLGKIWQVWNVNYQKITGAYSSPWKSVLHTCWSDHGLFGMSNYWDPDSHPDQTDIWGDYGMGWDSTSWGDVGRLKDSYEQSWINEGPDTVETVEDNSLLEDPCNPLVMVDVDQDSMVCQLENQNSELIPQIQFDLVSEVGSEYDNVLSDGETDQISNSEDDQSYGRCASYGDFQTMWSMVEHSTPKKFSLSRSFELVPSERSAFVDVVPKKIHHVQSEPNLVHPTRESESISTAKNRSCKSDSNSPEEHLYFSQKTHFQPIQSPVAQYTGSTYNLRDLFGGYAPSKTPYQKFQKVTTCDENYDDGEAFVPMFKIRKDQDKYIQTSLDSNDKEQTEENQADSCQLENEGKGFDFFEYVDNLTDSVESTPQNLLECVNNYVDSGYEDLDQYVPEKEEGERNGLYAGLVPRKKNMDPWSANNGFYPKGRSQRLCDGDNWQSKMYEYVNKEMPLDTSTENTCFCGMVANAGNWQENPNQDASVCRPPVHRWVIQEAWGLNPGSGGGHSSEAANKHSIWSSGNEDAAFSEMFYYPGHDDDSVAEQFNMDENSSSKEDDSSTGKEHNLFQYSDDLVSGVRDTDCPAGGQISTDQPHPYQADSGPYGQSFMEMTSYFSDDFSDASKARPDQQCQLEKENHPPQTESDIVKVRLVIKKGKKKQDFENVDTHPPLFMPMPVAAVYSCELEHAWMNNMEVEYLFPQATTTKGKKKPCTFFLEGNCRRTDCKFAHDLSHITCRFWAEGDCFKGELCPFLHGYSPYMRNASERKDSKQFKYESEDFPNLTKTESKKERGKKDKYNKLNKYKASKTQLRTQINRKLQKSHGTPESTANPAKKLKPKGSQ